MSVRLQPSGSSCWMKCTAQPGFIARHADQLPANTDTPYTIEGTKAHHLAAACLLMGYDAALFDDVEMAAHVKGYVELIQSWAEVPDCTLVVEESVPLFYSPEDRVGTRDACVVANDGSWLRIGDLKYGAGVSVQARYNTQLAIYGLSTVVQLEESGLYSFTDETLITLLIYQPRVIGEKPIRLWALTLRELREFCMEIELTANLIDSDPHSPLLRFAPSDSTCQFCEGSALCSARAGNLLGSAEMDSVTALTTTAKPSTPVFPAPERLSIAQLAKIVEVAPEMKKWLDRCEALGASLLHAAKPFPGFKLVEGKSNRDWEYPEVAESVLYEHLGGEIYTPAKLKSPAQIETLMKLHKETLPEGFDALLSDLIIKPKGNPVMVPENDRRTAFQQNPADFFTDLTQDGGLLS